MMSTIARQFTSAPSRNSILALYKAMLKDSLKFENYNFREYFLRKTKYEFQKNKGLKDQSEIEKAYQTALKEYEVLKRQSQISQMYKFEKSVLENAQ